MRWRGAKAQERDDDGSSVGHDVTDVDVIAAATVDVGVELAHSITYRYCHAHAHAHAHIAVVCVGAGTSRRHELRTYGQPSIVRARQVLQSIRLLRYDIGVL